MKRGRKLTEDFYQQADALELSRLLLGQRLVVPTPQGERVSGLIVETEAYMGPKDKASHAFGGRRTARTETMYAAGGVAYVFFIYGMYYQFNVVVNGKDVPHVVLVRALQPEEGLESMRQRRGPEKPDRQLTSGPGKLCQAFGIDRSYDKEDLTGERIWIEETEIKPARREIASGPRIGIDYAAEYAAKPWRFWLKDNAYVSRK